MVENATDYKYSSAMYHAGLVNFDNEKMNDSGEAATVIR
jgi:hypothetical protein